MLPLSKTQMSWRVVRIALLAKLNIKMLKQAKTKKKGKNSGEILALSCDMRQNNQVVLHGLQCSHLNNAREWFGLRRTHFHKSNDTSKEQSPLTEHTWTVGLRILHLISYLIKTSYDFSWHSQPSHGRAEFYSGCHVFSKIGRLGSNLWNSILTMA